MEWIKTALLEVFCWKIIYENGNAGQVSTSPKSSVLWVVSFGILEGKNEETAIKINGWRKLKQNKMGKKETPEAKDLQ